MTDNGASERLYDQLQDRLRARDKEGAIEAYYQLFLAGRPLGEVISKGALDQSGRSDFGPPIETAPDEQAACVVCDDTQALRPGSCEQGSEIASEVRSVGAASGSNIDAHRWFVRRKVWVVGGMIGISALVAPMALVNGTSLGQVAAAIKRTTNTAALAISSTNTAPAKPGSKLTGPNAELNMNPLPKAAELTGAVTSATAVPNPPVATDPARKVVATAMPAREEGADQPGRTPPSKPAEAPGPAADAAAEAAPNPSVAADASPKVVVAATTEHAGPRPSGIETKALVSRADALFGSGDLTAARLFYRRGADLGDGTAALRLGETFDPAF